MKPLPEVADYYAPRNLTEFLADFYISQFLMDERKAQNVLEFTYDRCFEMIHTYGVREMIAYEISNVQGYEQEFLLREYVAYFFGHQSHTIYAENIALEKYNSFQNLMRVGPLFYEDYSHGETLDTIIQDHIDDDILHEWREKYEINEYDITDFANSTKNLDIMARFYFLDPLHYADIQEIYENKHYFNDIPISDFFHHIQNFPTSPEKRLLTDNCLYFINHPYSPVSIDKIVDAEHHTGLLLTDMQGIFFQSILIAKSYYHS